MRGGQWNHRITADDFGLDAGVNAAIAKLASAGAIDATSLLVYAPLATEALALEVRLPVGLQVEMSREFLQGASSEAVRTAIDDQVQWMTSRGTPPAHLDLHTVALYGIGPEVVRPGGVLPEALSIAAELGITLRLPRHLPPGIGPVGGHEELVAAADAAGVDIPFTIASDFRPAEQVANYADLREHYGHVLGALPDEPSEVFLHPALPAPHGDEEPSADRRKRHYEYRLLSEGLPLVR